MTINDDTIELPFDSPRTDALEFNSNIVEGRDPMKKAHVEETLTSSPRATYQDVLDAPPHMVAEIVDGTLYTNPRPAMLQAKAKSGLGGLISQTYEYGRGGPGGWWILDEPELHLCEDILVPDVAGWQRERMSEYPVAAYFTLPPDWVCEVLSPSTRKLDLGPKRAVYAREGVSYLWLVDPDVRSLETFERRSNDWVLNDTLFDDALVSLPPFDAISFNLGDLWPPHTVHKDLPRKPTIESQPELTAVSK